MFEGEGGVCHKNQIFELGSCRHVTVVGLPRSECRTMVDSDLTMGVVNQPLSNSYFEILDVMSQTITLHINCVKYFI